MKVIDLINTKEKREDLPEKMIINKRIFHSNCFRNEIYEEDCNTNIWLSLNLQHIRLDDEVEIIEEQQDIDIQAIEEMRLISGNVSDFIIDNRTKINELIQAVKQLDRREER